RARGAIHSEVFIAPFSVSSLLPRIRTAAPRVSAARASGRGAVLQTLESRTLLSAVATPAVDASAGVGGPQIIGVHVIGPPTDASGVVVTFNESMDPATAQDKASYVLVKHINTDSKDEGGGFFDIP